MNYNANIQAFRNNVFNILIIIFSFLSVLVGTLTYSFGQLVELSAISGDEPSAFGVRVPNPDLVLQVTTIVNIILPMLTSLFMAMNSAFSPGSKYTALYHQALFVESEIFKVRTHGWSVQASQCINTLGIARSILHRASLLCEGLA